MVANAAFHATTSWAMIRVASDACAASRAGFPMLAGASTPVTKPRLNMNGWNCSAASSSQTTPSPICRPRRAPADFRSAAHARPRRSVPGRSVPARRSVVCDDGGKNKVPNAAAEPAAATHRPGPPRATTMEFAPSTLRLRVSWISRYAEKPRAANPVRPASHRVAWPPRIRW